MADRETASEASTKVQEAAANIQQAAATRKRISGSKAEAIARRYFEAIAARDLERRCRCGRPAGARTCAARSTCSRPRACASSSATCSARCPTCSMQVISTTTEGERCGVQWRLTGTFAGPGGFGGVAPTGSPSSSKASTC